MLGWPWAPAPRGWPPSTGAKAVFTCLGLGASRRPRDLQQMAFPHHPQMWGLPNFFLEFVEGELPERSVPEVARGSEVGTHWGASLRLRDSGCPVLQRLRVPYCLSFAAFAGNHSCPSWWPGAFPPLKASLPSATCPVPVPGSEAAWRVLGAWTPAPRPHHCMCFPVPFCLWGRGALWGRER